MPALPPGPGIPRALQTLKWTWKPIPFMRACARTYGDAFTVRLLGFAPLVLCSHPSAIREIFSGDPETLLAGRSNELLKPVFGANSILLLDGARHRRERKLLMPSFHGERLRLYANIMRETVDRSIEDWPVGRVFPIHKYMQEITLDIILRLVFGLHEGEMWSRLRALLVEFLGLTGSGPALLIPGLQIDLGPLTPWGRFRRLVQEIDRLLYDEIARCRKEGPQGRADVMAMFLTARDENDEPMNDDEIRDELITMLVAGHETTATSLSWVVHRLLQNADVLEKARAEAATVFGNGLDGSEPAPEQIAALHYLDAVIKETARLHPIVPIVSRYLEAPTRIGDLHLPAGCGVSPCIYLAHRRPDVWAEPEAFKPDRFIDARVDPYAFFPFGGGARHCLGAAFAVYEMKIVLARILTRVPLRTDPTRKVRTVRRGVTLAPSGGVPVIRVGGGFQAKEPHRSPIAQDGSAFGLDA